MTNALQFTILLGFAMINFGELRMIKNKIKKT
jgi:hypothetical protein